MQWRAVGHAAGCGGGERHTSSGIADCTKLSGSGLMSPLSTRLRLKKIFGEILRTRYFLERVTAPPTKESEAAGASSATREARRDDLRDSRAGSSASVSLGPCCRSARFLWRSFAVIPSAPLPPIAPTPPSPMTELNDSLKESRFFLIRVGEPSGEVSGDGAGGGRCIGSGELSRSADDVLAVGDSLISASGSSARRRRRKDGDRLRRANAIGLRLLPRGAIGFTRGPGFSGTSGDNTRWVAGSGAAHGGRPMVPGMGTQSIRRFGRCETEVAGAFLHVRGWNLPRLSRVVGSRVHLPK